jgi:hypothetical protein
MREHDLNIASPLPTCAPTFWHILKSPLASLRIIYLPVILMYRASSLARKRTPRDTGVRPTMYHSLLLIIPAGLIMILMG